jgi:hypothetical protein
MKQALGITAACVAALLTAGTGVAAGTPTCSEVLGIKVHGQHIIGDYVTGLHSKLTWPPAGQVGAAVRAGGAVLPGGPGPGFHFPNGVAAGASFCNSQARSPGFHAP